MLKIINDLSPFFKDCYRELGVREYSRILRVSPPTASKMLKEFESNDLLKKREERSFLLFRANRESFIFWDLSRIYWKYMLGKVINNLNLELHEPTIILFGSLAKLEAKSDSDVDLAVFTDFKKKLNLDKFEKELKRKIQLFRFKSISEIDSKELKINILNGYIIQGGVR